METTPSSRQWHKPFAHDSQWGGLMSIIGSNILKSMATLGIWRFWGIVNIRRYLWGHSTLWGDALDFVGTGSEICRGFFLALILFGLPYFAISYAGEFIVTLGGHGLIITITTLVLSQYLVLSLLSLALFRARRYHLLRTQWRGLNLQLDVKTASYFRLWLKQSLVVFVSLGLFYGWHIARREAFLLNHTSYGGRKFVCDGGNIRAILCFIPLWIVQWMLLAIVLFASYLMVLQNIEMDLATIYGATILYVIVNSLASILPWSWFQKRLYQQLAENTTHEGIHFRLEIPFWRLVRLNFGNALILLGGLGLLAGWAKQRTLRVIGQYLEASDLIDPTQYKRNDSSQKPGWGEGMLQVLDGGL